MINKNLILFIYLGIFSLSCDNRQPSESEENNIVEVSTLQVYGNSIINVIDLEEEISIDFYALPLDENGVFLSTFAPSRPRKDLYAAHSNCEFRQNRIGVHPTRPPSRVVASRAHAGRRYLTPPAAAAILA